MPLSEVAVTTAGVLRSAVLARDFFWARPADSEDRPLVGTRS